MSFLINVSVKITLYIYVQIQTQITVFLKYFSKKKVYSKVGSRWAHLIWALSTMRGEAWFESLMLCLPIKYPTSWRFLHLFENVLSSEYFQRGLKRHAVGLRMILLLKQHKRPDSSCSFVSRFLPNLLKLLVLD